MTSTSLRDGALVVTTKAATCARSGSLAVVAQPFSARSYTLVSQRAVVLVAILLLGVLPVQEVQ